MFSSKKWLLPPPLLPLRLLLPLKLLRLLPKPPSKGSAKNSRLALPHSGERFSWLKENRYVSILS
jgi:hypothetical protein